jgi:hypothetical protein
MATIGERMQALDGRKLRQCQYGAELTSDWPLCDGEDEISALSVYWRFGQQFRVEAWLGSNDEYADYWTHDHDTIEDCLEEIEADVRESEEAQAADDDAD